MPLGGYRCAEKIAIRENTLHEIICDVISWRHMKLRYG